MSSAAEEFEFEFDSRFALLLRAISVTPGSARVTVDDTHFTARFGLWKVETPITNIKETTLTGDYRWYRAIGVRLSLTDRGLTFGTNTKRGLCVTFAEPVRGLPGMRHSDLTVTVRDPETLKTTIEERLSRPPSRD